MMKQQTTGKMPSMIQHADNNGEASFFQNSQSFVFVNDEMHPGAGGLVGNSAKQDGGIDDYTDDDDPGFEIYVVSEENFVASCKELAAQNDFPVRAIRPDTKEQIASREKYRRQYEQMQAV